MNSEESNPCKIRSEDEDNSSHEENTSLANADITHPLDMKLFWKNIDSYGFAQNEYKFDAYLAKMYIDYFAQKDYQEDSQEPKAAYPKNINNYTPKYLERLIRKDEPNFFENKPYNKFYEKKNLTLQQEINFLSEQFYKLEYENNYKSQNIKEKYNKKLKKDKEAIKIPREILGIEERKSILAEQIFALQMKQFAESICRVQKNAENIYKIFFDLNDKIPSIELNHKDYLNFIKYRDPLNSISVYDLFQEKTHSYYNTEKNSKKKDIQEVEKGFDFYNKNSKIKIKTSFHKNHSKQRSLNKYNIKKTKYRKGEDFIIAKKIQVEYFYCHHCKQRKPEEVSVKCKTSLNGEKHWKRPPKTFIVNGSTVIRSK